MTRYIIDTTPYGMYPMMILTGIKQIIREKPSKSIIRAETMIPIGGKAISQNQGYGKISRSHPVRAVPRITIVGIPVIQTGIQTGDVFKKQRTVFRLCVKRIRLTA